MDTFKLWIIFSYTFRITLVVSSVYMASNGVKGWGWLIFVAAITGLSNEKEGN